MPRWPADGPWAARGAQALDQLAGIDRGGTGGDRPVDPGIGDVVVVAVEGSLGKPEAGGELVELVVGRVADEVGEAPAVGRPDRLVDEDHRVRVPGRTANPARRR